MWAVTAPAVAGAVVLLPVLAYCAGQPLGAPALLSEWAVAAPAAVDRRGFIAKRSVVQYEAPCRSSSETLFA